MKAFPARQRGFSLVEIVMAIIVMSVLAVGLTQFITNSAGGYATTATRNQLSGAARAVVDRLAMELHNALPESIRISNVRISSVTNQFYAGDQCIEFIPVVAATTYIDPTFRPSAANANPFDVVDFVPAKAPPTLTGHYAVIYPTSSGDLYKDSYGTTEAIVEVEVDDADTMDGTNEITPIPPATNHRFRRDSPADRLYLVAQPISYCITGSRLYRYSDYGFHTVQLNPVYVDLPGTCPVTDCLPATTPGRALITDQLDNASLNGAGNQAFDQIDASRSRNALIQLDLNFGQNGEQLRLSHEILQQMTP